MLYTINRLAVAGLLLTLNFAAAQSNNQTSSPYSLFGLGSLNEANAGKTNALGKSGSALSGETAINNLNPAAYADIHFHSFMFDIGAKGQRDTYANARDQNVHTTSNFSNISIALAFSEKSGIGLTMNPYSDVGYYLQGVTGTIEGSAQTYKSDITGSGGLNNVVLNYGRKLSPKFNIGINGMYYFGKINETELITLDNDYLNVTELNYYKGVRVGVGMQYKINDKLTLSSVATAPATLKGSQDRSVYKNVDYLTSTVETTTNRIAGFKLPAEIVVGVKYSFLPTLTFNADYKRTFWDAAHMKDNIGTFTDQDFVGMGLEYFGNKPRADYLGRIKYRLGYNADNGYLEVNDTRIKNFAVTSGLGLPLSIRGGSFINVSYSYGQRGLISNTLVKEKYHLVTVNISLEDIWFIKRKYE